MLQLVPFHPELQVQTFGAEQTPLKQPLEQTAKCKSCYFPFRYI